MTKVMKECRKHGMVPHVTRSDGGYRCRQCRIDAVNKRRQKLKLIAIDYKGNSCEKCGTYFPGYPEVMEFHHIDPTKKDFGISEGGFTRSETKMKVELDKCLMLCCNCHRILHVDLKK